jgi:prepilin signal peptidase PulO-like enzyme (type II secretory pathway)
MFWATVVACAWLLGSFIYLLFGMDFVDVLLSMVLIATCVAWYGALLIVMEIRANNLAVKLKEELDENTKG